MSEIYKHLKGGSLKAQLLRGASGSAGMQAVNLLLTLVSGVMLARILGPESYGSYTFALSMVTLLSLPVKAGLPALLIREMAKNQLNKHWGTMKGLFKASNYFAIGYSLFVVSVSAVSLFLFKDGSEAVIATLFWALFLLPLMAFEAVRAGTLRGLRWVVSAQIPEQIVRPLILIILISILVFFEGELDALKAIQFNLVGAFVAFLVGAFFLIKALPSIVKKASPEYCFKLWGASLIPLSMFAGLKLLDSQLSILFLGFLATEEEVGLFRVASTGAGLVAFGLTAVNMAMAPQVSRLYNAGDIKKLQRVITLSTRVVAVLSFPIAIFFIFFGDSLISFVFGDEYVLAAPALAVLCLGQLINTSSGSVALVLNMTGNERYTVISAAIALVINFLLSISLIPFIGVMGAAIGFSVSLSAWNIILAIIAEKKVGIKTFLGAR